MPMPINPQAFMGAMPVVEMTPDFGGIPTNMPDMSSPVKDIPDVSLKPESVVAQQKLKALYEAGEVDEDGMYPDGTFFRGPEAQKFRSMNGNSREALRKQNLDLDYNARTVAENRALLGKPALDVNAVKEKYGVLMGSNGKALGADKMAKVGNSAVAPMVVPDNFYPPRADSEYSEEMQNAARNTVWSMMNGGKVNNRAADTALTVLGITPQQLQMQMDRNRILAEQGERRLAQGERRLEQGDTRLAQGQQRTDAFVSQGEARLAQGDKRLEQGDRRLDQTEMLVEPRVGLLESQTRRNEVLTPAQVAKTEADTELAKARTLDISNDNALNEQKFEQKKAQDAQKQENWDRNFEFLKQKHGDSMQLREAQQAFREAEANLKQNNWTKKFEADQNYRDERFDFDKQMRKAKMEQEAELNALRRNELDLKIKGLEIAQDEKQKDRLRKRGLELRNAVTYGNEMVSNIDRLFNHLQKNPNLGAGLIAEKIPFNQPYRDTERLMDALKGSLLAESVKLLRAENGTLGMRLTEKEILTEIQRFGALGPDASPKVIMDTLNHLSQLFKARTELARKEAAEEGVDFPEMHLGESLPQGAPSLPPGFEIMGR